MNRLPYENVRIIEKSATLTGRLIGLLFADQGADVFVERGVAATLSEHDPCLYYRYGYRRITALVPESQIGWARPRVAEYRSAEAGRSKRNSGSGLRARCGSTTAAVLSTQQMAPIIARCRSVLSFRTRLRMSKYIFPLRALRPIYDSLWSKSSR